MIRPPTESSVKFAIQKIVYVQLFLEQNFGIKIWWIYNHISHIYWKEDSCQNFCTGSLTSFNLVPTRLPLATADAGLETGYPEKICHHDDDRRRTKTHPPNRGRSIFILVTFYRFWTHVKFFRGLRKKFSTNCLLFRMISRNLFVCQ